MTRTLEFSIAFTLLFLLCILGVFEYLHLSEAHFKPLLLASSFASLCTAAACMVLCLTQVSVSFILSACTLFALFHLYTPHLG